MPSFTQTESINAVITGASGAIGKAMLALLAARTDVGRIFALSRSGPPESSGEVDDSKITWVNFDADQSESLCLAAEQVSAQCDRLHLVFNAVGILHQGDVQPEKSVKDLSEAQLLRVFTVNSFVLPLLARQLSSLLKHKEGSMFASLSARVGSISDNRLGGWYSYRASKAAHNMLLKTLSLEWKISHPRTTCIALHPGTVKSALSAPFVNDRYKNRVLTPDESASHLWQVMASCGPDQTGSFFAWDGTEIPW